MNGRDPRILLDIHSVSDVNRPEIELSELPRPAFSDDFPANKKEVKEIKGKLLPNKRLDKKEQ